MEQLRQECHTCTLTSSIQIQIAFLCHQQLISTALLGSGLPRQQWKLVACKTTNERLISKNSVEKKLGVDIFIFKFLTSISCLQWLLFTFFLLIDGLGKQMIVCKYLIPKKAADLHLASNYDTVCNVNCTLIL